MKGKVLLTLLALCTVTSVQAITASYVQTNVTCNSSCNGSSTVTPAGGTGPYSYSWSPSGGTAATATGLCAGTYTCTVRDATLATTSVVVTITQPSAMGTLYSQVNVSCNGGSNGSATVSVFGGTGTKTYSWAPTGGNGITASGLTAGNYTVTVTDANSCTVTQTFTLTQPPAISTSVSQTNISCNGGSNGVATVNASGGAGSFTYSWAPIGGSGSSATGLTAGSYTVTVTDGNSCTATRTYMLTQPSTALTTAGSQTNLSCNGGSNGTASVVASGGTGSYSYSWAPYGGTSATASGLIASNYTVTVTDANSCTATRTFSITQPSALNISPTQTNISCNGGSNGSATASVSGGTGTYTYSWAPSGGSGPTASGRTAGTYTVTVTDANSCTATRTFILTQPSAISTFGSAINVACNGGSTGSATVSASGGSSPYTYSWAPSGGNGTTASGRTAGTYTVTVSDANSCTATRTFTITQPPALNTSGSQNNVSCNGGSNGSATVVASGGTAPYFYSWSPYGGTGATASGLTASNFTVTVTDANNCNTTRSFILTQPTAVTGSMSIGQVNCYGSSTGSITLTPSGGTPGYTYNWGSGINSKDRTGLMAGTYTVTITDASNCTGSVSGTVTQPATASTTWLGVDTSWINAANWSCGIPTAATNVLIDGVSISTMPVISTTALARNITFTNGGSASFKTGGWLELSGNISGTGLNANNGGIRFAGSSVQTMTGLTAAAMDVTNNTGVSFSGPIVLTGGLTMNGAGSLITTSSIQVGGTLTLTNGNITLGSSDLSASILSGGSAASYVVTAGTGTLKAPVNSSATVTFPVGRTAYNPATLYNTGNSDQFSVRVYSDVTANGTEAGTSIPQSVKSHVGNTWMIDDINNAGAVVAMTLQFNNGQQNSTYFDPNHTFLAHYNGGAGKWEDFRFVTPNQQVAVVSPGVYSVTNTVNSFSPFTITSGGLNGSQPLPIILTSFSARNEDQVNIVKWTSAMEKDLAYYEVERSADGRSFTSVAREMAKGKAASYTVYDRAPITGKSYYRLRIFAKAGESEYSSIATAFRSADGVFALTAMPHPVTDHLTIEVHGGVGSSRVTLTDMTGNVLKDFYTGSEIEIDMSSLSPGVYVIRYTDASHRQSLKVIKR